MNPNPNEWRDNRTAIQRLIASRQGHAVPYSPDTARGAIRHQITVQQTALDRGQIGNADRPSFERKLLALRAGLRDDVAREPEIFIAWWETNLGTASATMDGHVFTMLCDALAPRVGQARQSRGSPSTAAVVYAARNIDGDARYDLQAFDSTGTKVETTHLNWTAEEVRDHFPVVMPAGTGPVYCQAQDPLCMRPAAPEPKR